MFRQKWWFFSIALAAVVFAANCESEHQVYDGSIPDADGDAGTAADGDGNSEAVATCSGHTGVTVSGTVKFAGTVPAPARLWIFWKAPAGGIPPCSLEVKPPVFPARFRFEQVPNQGWSLVAFIDVDGGFPPIPASGDYLVEVPAADLNLSADIENLVLEIPTTPVP